MGDERPRRRFSLVPARSAILIEARSNVGPITFAGSGVTGEIDVPVDTGRLDLAAAAARLELRVDQLTSGNSLYDNELQRRIDARRFPRSIVDLCSAEPLATGGYRVTGAITFHQVTRTLAGSVTVTMPDDGHIAVSGEEDVDIRDFNLVPPTMLMLRIQPIVRVRLHVEADVAP